MRCRIFACLFLAAAAGCDAHSNSLVVVDLSANAPLDGVTELACSARAGTRTVTFNIKPPSGSFTLDPGTQSFGIDLPTSVTGSIHVHVDAKGAAGTLASGDADGTIKPQQRLELPLQLIVVGQMPPPPDDMAQAGDMEMPSGPQLTTNNSAQNFGAVTQNGMSSAIDITITNAGDMPTSDLAFSTAGTNLDQFSIVNKSCTGVLQPQAKCAVTVQFLPKVVGNDMTASFTVQATSGGSVTTTLSGNSTAPGKLTITPTGDCGAALIGTKSAKSASFTVTNTGDNDTGMTTATTGDAGTGTQQFFATGCGGVLGPGQTCTVTVTFTPNARGTQTTSVSVSANPGGQANATVTGIGQAAASFSIAPAAGSSATFAPQLRNSTSAAMTFVATNVGDVQSPLLSTPVTSDSTTFPVTGNSCNNNAIAPGASCNIQVAFAPPTSTTLSTTLSVIAQVNGTPTALGKLTLTGTGLPIWQQETPPASITVPTSFYAVSGTGPSLVLFGGPTGAILQRTASGSVTWTNVSLNFPFPPDVNVLWTTTNPSTKAPQEYLVDDAKAIMSTNAPPNWANVSGAPSPVTGLYGFSTADFWTSDTTATNNVYTSSFYHWNGSSWVTETSTQGGAVSLWGTSDSDLYAYGSDVEGSLRKTIIIHRNAAGTWSLQGAGQLPTLGITANGVCGLNGMWGFGTPANDVYAITSGQGLFHSTGDGNWAQVPNAPAGTQGVKTICKAVWGATASAVWVACPGGVYVYDGVNKVWGTTGLVASGVTFNALWGSGPNDVYAVGDNGTTGIIYHYY